MTSDKKEQLIQVALDLFYRNGFKATGIDTLLREAGLAKMTLYNHFGSKEELILAALRRQDELWRRDLAARVDALTNARNSEPSKKLLAVFDVLEEWFADEVFHGCHFINAASEYGDPASPVHMIAAEHKRLIELYFRRLAEEAGFSDPQAVAEQVAIIYDGAVVKADIFRRPEVARAAKAAAKAVLQHFLRDTSA